VGSVCTSTVPVTSSGTLTVATNSTLNVQGNVVLTSSSTLVGAIFNPSSSTTALLSSTGNVTVDGALQLVIGTASSGTVTIVEGAVITGTFSSVQAISSDPCLSVTPPAPVYGVSAITISLQTTNTCTGGGLSTGAIVGIVVGGVLGLALIVAIVGVLCRRRREKKESQRIQMQLQGSN
jgi:hypothetical protein